jgi:hypothetical protein
MASFLLTITLYVLDNSMFTIRLLTLLKPYMDAQLFTKLAWTKICLYLLHIHTFPNLLSYVCSNCCDEYHGPLERPKIVTATSIVVVNYTP